jgi:hypothetical protein
MQRIGRLGFAEHRLARAHQIVNRALGRDARVARRTGSQMIFHGPPIGVGELAVDERGDERIERLTVMH